jgi:hypothetical protein
MAHFMFVAAIIFRRLVRSPAWRAQAGRWVDRRQEIIIGIAIVKIGYAAIAHRNQD